MHLSWNNWGKFGVVTLPSNPKTLAITGFYLSMDFIVGKTSHGRRKPLNPIISAFLFCDHVTFFTTSLHKSVQLVANMSQIGRRIAKSQFHPANCAVLNFWKKSEKLPSSDLLKSLVASV